MNDDLFPARYSTLDLQAIGSRILSQYEIGTVKVCEFWCRGLSDVYFVKTDRDDYILRVSHWGWRSESDIYFELELLDFLHRRDLPVAHPLRTKEGKLSIVIRALEGDRYATLFTYAPGTVVSGDLSIQQAHKLGETLAQVHQAGLEFQSNCDRQSLTLEYLVDRSWSKIAPFLEINDRHYLETANEQISAILGEFPRSSPYWGICWGDPHSGNIHFDKTDRPTLFDFDQCGFGWRAFDLGKFRQVALSKGTSQQVRSAFLQGYRSITPLTDIELAAIPVFTQVAHIWVWSISLSYAIEHNYSRLNNLYFRQRVEELKKLKSPDWQMF